MDDCVKMVLYRKYFPTLSVFYMPCPGCGNRITFKLTEKIILRTKHQELIQVPGLWNLIEGCVNPFCQWSNVKSDKLLGGV